MISREGFFTNDILPRSSPEDGTDFHSLGDESGIIVFLDFTRCKADLVAIGAVAFGCTGRKLALRQFTNERILNDLTRSPAPVTRMAWYT